MSQAPREPTQRPDQEPGLDAAQQSLADALRVSFTLLKALMVLLLVIYVFSGLFRIEDKQIGVSYIFGERLGTHAPGWHIGFPFPIQNNIKVPLTQQTTSVDSSFWYDNPENLEPDQLANRELDPLVDSFLITGDGNVVHVQFEVKYVIAEDAVEDYLRNVGSLELADELVRTAAERGMIHSIASAELDDIINKNYDSDRIVLLTQQVLNELSAGITVQQVVIGGNQSMPNQVRSAYEEVTQAEADKVKSIQEARRTFDETLGRTAGASHPQLLMMIRAYEAALSREQSELATTLREELNASIRALRLPREGVLDAIAAYQSAATDAAGRADDQTQQAVQQASQQLLASLQSSAQMPADQRFDRPIRGEIASAINGARANRSAIATKARLDYERYASALDAYRDAPLVLANDRLQATREAVMSGLVQNIVGEIGEVRTNADPEVQEEIAEAELQRRRENAQAEEAARRGQ